MFWGEGHIFCCFFHCPLNGYQVIHVLRTSSGAATWSTSPKNLKHAHASEFYRPAKGLCMSGTCCKLSKTSIIPVKGVLCCSDKKKTKNQCIAPDKSAFYLHEISVTFNDTFQHNRNFNVTQRDCHGRQRNESRLLFLNQLQRNRIVCMECAKSNEKLKWQREFDSSLRLYCINKIQSISSLLMVFFSYFLQAKISLYHRNIEHVSRSILPKPWFGSRSSCQE